MEEVTPPSAPELIRLSKLHNLPRVVVESPYAGDINYNISYAHAAMLDCLLRTEAPILSHLLYPYVLRDSDPEERDFGILAGHSWMVGAHYVAVYTDLGMSRGMEQGIRTAELLGRSVVYRQIPDWENFVANHRNSRTDRRVSQNDSEIPT